MKKQINIAKLTILAASVAALGAGCASSDYAQNNRGSQVTVSALSFNPVTNARELNKWPIDISRNLQAIDTYTFVVPVSDRSVDVATVDTAAAFDPNMPAGTEFREAAGADGTPRTVRVIRHSPNPR